MKYLVMDFGGTQVKLSVRDKEAKALLRWELPAPLGSLGEFLSLLERTYEELRRKHRIGGVALSLPGVIDVQRRILRTAGPYQGLYGVNLGEELSKRIGVSFALENAGNCAALAELWKGGLKDCRDGAVLVLGNGIEGGIILDGKLRRGYHQAAGAFSQYLSGDGTGADGLVFRYGMSALLHEAGRRKKALPSFSGMDLAKFFTLLGEKDPVIEEIYESFLESLSRMIFHLQLSLAPRRVLIGGEFDQLGWVVSDVRQRVGKLSAGSGPLPPLCPIERCTFGNEACQVGALYHLLDQMGKGRDLGRKE